MSDAVSRGTRIPRWAKVTLAAVLLVGLSSAVWSWAHPVIDVYATANGQRVQAEVVVDGTVFGETSAGNARTTCEFRPQRGQPVEYTLQYAGFQKTEDLPPQRGHQYHTTDLSTVTITFRAYDTSGRELKDDLGVAAMVKVGDAPWEMLPAQRTELIGTKRTIRFKSNDVRFARQGALSAEVEWLNRAAYSTWLDSDLRNALIDLADAYDDARWQGIIAKRLKPLATETTHEYPCVFAATERSLPAPPMGAAMMPGVGGGLSSVGGGMPSASGAMSGGTATTTGSGPGASTQAAAAPGAQTEPTQTTSASPYGNAPTRGRSHGHARSRH